MDQEKAQAVVQDDTAVEMAGCQDSMAQLVRMLHQQMLETKQRQETLESEANAREARLMTMLQDALQAKSNTPQKPHSVGNASCPVLTSCATLQELSAWKEQWKDYAQCQQVGSQTPETQVAALRQCIDDDLRRFIRQGIIDIKPNADMAETITAIDSFFRKQRNPLLDRVEFYHLQQEKDESFNNYLTTLKELYNACDFESRQLCWKCSSVVSSCSRCCDKDAIWRDEIMRDKLVVGVHDDETRHLLLAESDLTMDSAVRICRSHARSRQGHSR